MELNFREKINIKEFNKNFKNNDIFIFPTETVYGLGTLFNNNKGIDRIFNLKKREKKPLALYFYNFEDSINYVEHNDLAKKLAQKFLPGPLTLICGAKLKLNNHLVLNNKIGIRISSNKIIREILKELKFPIAATSANFSGERSYSSYKKIDKEIKLKVDLSIDGGEIKSGIESTIVDITTSPPTIIREGYIKKREIIDFLKNN